MAIETWGADNPVKYEKDSCGDIVLKDSYTIESLMPFFAYLLERWPHSFLTVTESGKVVICLEK